MRKLSQRVVSGILNDTANIVISDRDMLYYSWSPLLRSNVLPMEVDIQRDYFTESSASAARAVFASWSLEGCKQW
jgi:hypothetical protein